MSSSSSSVRQHRTVDPTAGWDRLEKTQTVVTAGNLLDWGGVKAPFNYTCLSITRDMVSIVGLAINAVVGLVILVVANAIGFGVQVSLLTLAICAILGIPGAVLVMLLAFLDVAFMAVMAAPLLV